MKFLKGFLKEPRRVASIAPSSQFVAKKMIKPIDFAKAKIIVELGGGTGAFTKAILKKMRSDAKLLCFETNNTYIKALSKIPDKRLVLIQDGAEELSKYVSKADAIVSGLPLVTLPKQLVLKILTESAAILSSKGVFTQIQYSLTTRKLLKNYFSEVKIDFSPLNIPPSFVYICRK